MNRTELRKIFELMDTDRDGHISFEELRTGQHFYDDVNIKLTGTESSDGFGDKRKNLILACRQYNMNLTDDGIKHIMAQTDKDGNGEGMWCYRLLWSR